MFPTRHLFFFKDTFWLKMKMLEKIIPTMIANREQKKPGWSQTKDVKLTWRVWYGWEGGKGLEIIMKICTCTKCQRTKVNSKRKKRKITSMNSTEWWIHTHNWSKCREASVLESSATNEHVYHSSSNRAQGTQWKKGWKNSKSQKWDRRRLMWSAIFWLWQDHYLQTQSSCDIDTWLAQVKPVTFQHG